jgi:peptidoglycan hydrolase-like protein with peptidoglycan-binding domain
VCFSDLVRVVEPTVDPSTGFLPARGYWRKGDTDPRIGQMSAWMRSTFPAYTPASALGQYFGPNLEKSVREFQRRTNLLADGCVGPKTYAKMQAYGFKG